MLHRKRKERKRAMEKGKKLAFLYGLENRRGIRRREEIRISEPNSFNGSHNGNPSYQRWFEKLHDYL